MSKVIASIKKAAEKAREKGKMFFTVRVDQVRKLIQQGEYDRIIIKYSYTDDYAWDAANDFGRGRIDRDPDEMERLMYWLKPGTRCYGDLDEPREIRITPYSGLMYVLVLKDDNQTPEPETIQMDQEKEKLSIMITFDNREYKALLAGVFSYPDPIPEVAQKFASPKILLTWKMWWGVVHLLESRITKEQEDHFWTYESWARVETMKVVRQKILNMIGE